MECTASISAKLRDEPASHPTSTPRSDDMRALARRTGSAGVSCSILHWAQKGSHGIDERAIEFALSGEDSSLSNRSEVYGSIHVAGIRLASRWLGNSIA